MDTVVRSAPHPISAVLVHTLVVTLTLVGPASVADGHASDADWDVAVRDWLAERVSRPDPDPREVRGLAARMFRGEGGPVDVPGARRVLGAVLGTGNTDVAVDLVEHLVASGDVDEALRVIEWSTALDPEIPAGVADRMADDAPDGFVDALGEIALETAYAAVRATDDPGLHLRRWRIAARLVGDRAAEVATVLPPSVVLDMHAHAAGMGDGPHDPGDVATAWAIRCSALGIPCGAGPTSRAALAALFGPDRGRARPPLIDGMRTEP